MTFLPSLWNGAFDWLDDFDTAARKEERALSTVMRTDVKEYDDRHELLMDLPGFTKEGIDITLDDGYLTVTAERKEENKEEKHGKVLRRERIYGTMKRSFYVGREIKDDDIKASFTDGVLTLSIPKKQPVIPEKKKIAIE